jgi:uroporphyrinogen decarboxylase
LSIADRKNPKSACPCCGLGGIDVDTLCRKSTDEIGREVVEKGTRFRSKAKGFGLGSGNSIPQYVPVEGFLAMVEAAKEIRRRERRAT